MGYRVWGSGVKLGLRVWGNRARVSLQSVARKTDALLYQKGHIAVAHLFHALKIIEMI